MWMMADIDHGDVTSPNPDDYDPYAWARAVPKVSPIIHIKQSLMDKGGHRPFTAEFNARGRIHPEPLLAAFADGALQGEQRVRLLEVAELLGFSRWELEQLLAMAEAEFSFARHGRQQGGQRQQGSAHGAHARQEPSRDRLQAAYTLLGVSSEATDSEVKRAYRKQMNKHHPDKLAAKGLPPEMQKMAKEKAQEIQQAWELIKQSRNLR